MKIVNTAEMRHLEEESAKAGISTMQLMENAGRAVAQRIQGQLDAVVGRNIVVLVGPGNNGGDGLVAARHLCDWGARVNVFMVRSRPDDDNLRLAQEAGAVISGPTTSELSSLLTAADVAVDALFGTGQSRRIEGVFKDVLDELAKAKRSRSALMIFAVDLPSGLNADTGQPDPATPLVDYTLTLGLSKQGLYTPEGAARAGGVAILDIGLVADPMTRVDTELMTDDLMRTLLPSRSPYSHKGSCGRAMVVAGSANYRGAAYLACAGVARVGTGLVALVAPENVISTVATKMPEAVYIPWPDGSSGVIMPEAAELAKLMVNYDALLVGPGLGQTASGAFIKCLCEDLPPMRLVLDADALNALAKTPEWWHGLGTEAVLTPHLGEMARLTGLAVEEIQTKRLDIAREKAAAWKKVVVLKGAFTVVAAPDGRCRVSPFANAALASAGTGDILAGVVTGLLGQGLSLFDAASLGVYLHASAGERVKAQMGDTGVLASDLLPELPRAIKALKAKI